MVTATAHYERNLLNEPVTFEEAKRSWRELPPEESIWHRMGAGNENNRKFVDKKTGRYEAVFYPDGRPVTDPLNEATFNCFGPQVLYGAPHAVLDVVPYFILGNTPRDMFTSARFKAIFNRKKKADTPKKTSSVRPPSRAQILNIRYRR